MSNKYHDIHGPITAELAEAEPIHERLFREEEDQCVDTRQPNIKPTKDSRLVQLGLPLSSAPCLNTSDSAYYSALKRH
jgi:hypothetical protein